MRKRAHSFTRTGRPQHGLSHGYDGTSDTSHPVQRPSVALADGSGIPAGVSDTPTGRNHLSIADLERHARDWIFDGEFRQFSQRTHESRRFIIDKLLWFLREKGYQECGLTELRQFLAYIGTGHNHKGGAGAMRT